jgi:enamine deaminase RidA (YjgF/YER057c/UK114 family)
MEGPHPPNAVRITPVNPPTLPRPRGYSHGIVGTGRVLFVAGQIGWNETGDIASDRFADQFDQALANVLSVVKEAGGAPLSLARLTVYVVDKTEYLDAQKEIGERYRARMGRHYPAMTLVEVKSLLEARAKVEIEATAVL